MLFIIEFINKKELSIYLKNENHCALKYSSCEYVFNVEKAILFLSDIKETSLMSTDSFEWSIYSYARDGDYCVTYNGVNITPVIDKEVATNIVEAILIRLKAL